MDGEGRLSSSANWEEQCVDAAEYELNSLEEKLAAEREVNSQRIWLSFQNAANAVAQLFRGSLPLFLTYQTCQIFYCVKCGFRAIFVNQRALYLL